MSGSHYNTALNIMRLVAKSFLIFLAACGLISLIACENNEQTNSTSISSGTVTTTTDNGHDSQHQGHTSIHTDIAHAEIIMSSRCHLELIAESKDHGINLNFHLENKASHEAILGAKVTTVAQRPDGSEETLNLQKLNLQYEAEGDHDIGSLETQARGTHGVTETTAADILIELAHSTDPRCATGERLS